jgi:hypothetical protein
MKKLLVSALVLFSLKTAQAMVINRSAPTRDLADYFELESIVPSPTLLIIPEDHEVPVLFSPLLRPLSKREGLRLKAQEFIEKGIRENQLRPVTPLTKEALIQSLTEKFLSLQETENLDFSKSLDLSFFQWYRVKKETATPHYLHDQQVPLSQ